MIFKKKNTDILGSGSFGIVREIKDWKGKKYAEKSIKNEICYSKIYKDQQCMDLSALIEISALMLLKNAPKKHPHIIKIKDVKMGEEYTTFSMNYYKRNLYEWIKETSFSQRMKYIDKIALQILSALHFITNYDMVHRDLKPNNIMMDKNKPVICDWGSSTCLTYRESIEYDVCTAYYRAPEIYLKQKTTIKSDLWSLGIILYNILTGLHLFSFQTDNEALSDIRNVLEKNNAISSVNIKYKLLQKKETLSQKDKRKFDNVCDLINKLLIFDHDSRIELNEAKNHPLFDRLLSKRKYKKLFVEEFRMNSLKSPCIKMFEKMDDKEQDVLMNFVSTIGIDKGTQRYITVNILRLLNRERSLRLFNYGRELISITYSMMKMLETSVIYIEDLMKMWNILVEGKYRIEINEYEVKNILKIEKEIFKRLDYNFML